MSEPGRILLYALVAGLSPLALLSTLAVLGSGRGRADGSAFGSGFLLAQSAVIVVAETRQRSRCHNRTLWKDPEA